MEIMEATMNMNEEIRALVRISEKFRKNKKTKSRWPAEFQLRVLRLIEEGYSPTVLSKKLNIPVQTYYHWRRVWKNSPKKNLNFIELSNENPDKLKNSPSAKKQETLSNQRRPSMATILLPNGAQIENVSTEIIFKALQDAISA